MKRLSTRTLVAGLATVGLLTVVAALLSWWAVAVAGLVALQLATALLCLAPGTLLGTPGPRGGSSSSGASGSGHDVEELGRRVDQLAARLTASVERTRVEVVDALAERGSAPADR